MSPRMGIRTCRPAGCCYEKNMSSSAVLSRLTLGVAATASTASGAIVIFDINPDVSRSDFTYSFGGVGVNSLNFANGTFAAGSTNLPSLFAVGTAYGAVRFQYGSSYNVAAVRPQPASVELSLMAAGSTVGPGLAFVNDTNLTNYNSDPSSGTRYVGLRLNQSGQTYYGWFEMSYSAPVNGFRDYTFTRFAFNDVAGQSILAGQTSAVPEASTLGLVGGLFGMVAAAHVRRRRQQQAAASDKFLALAAGEKLN